MSFRVSSLYFSALKSIIINIQGQITNCPHKNARLAGENEFRRAANHIASALLLIGSSDPEAFLKLDMIY